MSALLDRLALPRPDLCFYGLAPPKLGTPPERVAAIVDAQKKRLRALAPDALVVYDLQDESARQPEARPFPFLPTLAPDTYAHELMADLAVPKIVYRSVAGADRAPRPAPATARLRALPRKPLHRPRQKASASPACATDIARYVKYPAPRRRPARSAAERASVPPTIHDRSRLIASFSHHARRRYPFSGE
jgi:hypothetical protein